MFLEGCSSKLSDLKGFNENTKYHKEWTRQPKDASTWWHSYLGKHFSLTQTNLHNCLVKKYNNILLYIGTHKPYMYILTNCR